MAADTHNHGEPPGIWERIAALAGKTTYREPFSGHGTKVPILPPEHEVCVALAWSRRRDDPNDIGPDIALDMVTQNPKYRRKICSALAAALSADQSRWRGVIRRNRGWLNMAAFDGYLRVVYGHGCQKPGAVNEADWAVLTEASYRVLTTMAEEAVNRAARYLRRAG